MKERGTARSRARLGYLSMVDCDEMLLREKEPQKEGASDFVTEKMRVCSCNRACKTCEAYLGNGTKEA